MTLLHLHALDIGTGLGCDKPYHRHVYKRKRSRCGQTLKSNDVCWDCHGAHRSDWLPIISLIAVRLPLQLARCTPGRPAVLSTCAVAHKCSQQQDKDQWETANRDAVRSIEALPSPTDFGSCSGGKGGWDTAASDTLH